MTGTRVVLKKNRSIDITGIVSSSISSPLSASKDNGILLPGNGEAAAAIQLASRSIGLGMNFIVWQCE